MSLLETYLEQARITFGFMHLTAIRAARQLLKEMNEQDTRLAIYKLTNPAHIRLLWEVGLNQRLQDTALTRMNEIIEMEQKGSQK